VGLNGKIVGKMKVNHKHIASLCQDQEDSGNDKGGYMHKRGFFFNTEYKKRWFVLKGNLLFYFKSQGSLSDPTGVIFLENCIIKKNKTVSQPHFFYEFTLEFDGDDTRKYYLATTSEDATDNWIKAMSMASYAKQKQDLDNLQLELFKAEMCFGIHQIAHDVNVLRPAFDEKKKTSTQIGDSHDTFAKEDADSSDDEQHYRDDSPNGSPNSTRSKSAASRTSSRNQSRMTSTSSEPDDNQFPNVKVTRNNSTKSHGRKPAQPTLFTNLETPTPPTRDPSRIMKSNPNSTTSTMFRRTMSLHQGSSLPSYDQATTSTSPI